MDFLTLHDAVFINSFNLYTTLGREMCSGYLAKSQLGNCTAFSQEKVGMESLKWT